MKLRVEFTSDPFGCLHIKPLTNIGTLQCISCQERQAGDCMPLLDTYLGKKYMNPGGVHKPPLIQIEALMVILHEMFAFLMEKARSNCPSWMPDQPCACHRLMQQDCLHCPRPSAGQGNDLHQAFILSWSMWY